MTVQMQKIMIEGSDLSKACRPSSQSLREPWRRMGAESENQNEDFEMPISRLDATTASISSQQLQLIKFG